MQVWPSRDTSGIPPPDSAQIVRAPVRQIGDIGRWNIGSDTSTILHHSQFMRTDASHGGSVLQYRSGVFLRELGESGPPLQFHLNGIDGRGVAFTLDGRRLNDPYSGAFDPALLPLEYVEEWELESGGVSGYFGGNAAAGAVNAVTHQYNTNSPVTKIRYRQGPYEQTLTDGLYTQNVSRGVNVMLGFQRTVSDGRFANSAYDGWSARSRVRYDLSDRWNFWISDLYTRSVTGFNGGIDRGRSPSLFDEVTAVVRTEDASQTVYRRDVTIGGIAKLFPDTASTTRGWLSYSVIDRQYREGADPFDSTRIVDNTLTSFWGGQLEQRLDVPGGRIAVGAEYERRSFENSLRIPLITEHYTAVRALASVFPFSTLTLSGYVKEEFLREQNGFSFGVSAAVQLMSWLSVTTAYSSISRFATMQEYFWQTPLHVHNDGTQHPHDTERPSRELHRRAEGGFEVRASGLRFSLMGFHRTIHDAIVFRPLATSGIFPTATVAILEETQFRGLNADLHVEYWKMKARAAATLVETTEDQRLVRPVPAWTIHAEVTVSDRFFGDALEAQFGIRIQSQDAQDGLQFIPQHLLFTRQSATRLGGWTLLDLTLAVRVGDAHLNLAWGNITDVNYMITPFYPMPGSTITFGINWMFLD